jgi:hypothetical protein
VSLAPHSGQNRRGSSAAPGRASPAQSACSESGPPQRMQNDAAGIRQSTLLTVLTGMLSSVSIARSWSVAWPSVVR